MTISSTTVVRSGNASPRGLDDGKELLTVLAVLVRRRDPAIVRGQQRLHPGGFSAVPRVFPGTDDLLAPGVVVAHVICSSSGVR
jgi:hypothetical protein